MITPEILDCTLRDGGYYCGWDFPDPLVRRYVAAVAQTGIRWVEMGFRAEPDGGFSGKYKFCRDEHLRELFQGTDLGIAVMIDGKDFTETGGRVRADALRKLFVDATQSPVKLVRVTATTSTLEPVCEIVAVLHELGYQTSVNLMRASLLTEGDVAGAGERLERSAVDFFYLADSFGGLTPSGTKSLVRVARASFSRRFGFHPHDNMGLALANSLEASREGASIIDSSVLGMGRGAGNLRTEQLLLFLNTHEGREDLRASPLFEIVSSDFAELQRKLGWGVTLPYMLSGVYNVHPTYPQRLLEVAIRYSPMEVINVLESLHESGKGSSFDPSRLAAAVEQPSARKDPVVVSELVTDRVLPSHEGRDFLIVGSGPSVRERAADLNRFIREREPVVLECNLQDAIETASDHYQVFVNHRRLRQFGRRLLGRRAKVVLGLQAVERDVATSLEGLTVLQYPLHVHEGLFEVEAEACTVPYHVVGVYVLGLALRMGAKRIFLSGYDGYLGGLNEPDCKLGAAEIAGQREMEEFVRIIGRHATIADGSVEIRSLTPSSYGFATDSLYHYV